MRLLHDLAGNAFFVACTVLLSALLCTFLSSVGAFVVMALLWLPLVGVLPAVYHRLSRQAFEVHWIICLGVFLPIYAVTTYLPQLGTLLSVPPVTGIRATEVPLHPDAISFEFSDAVVQTRYAHVRTQRSYDARRSTTNVSHTLIAPLTDASWTPIDPVPAWAICSHGHASVGRCPDWSSRNGGAISPPPSTAYSRPADLVDVAVTSLKLRSIANPRLLVYGTSATAVTRDRVYLLLCSTVGLYLLWAVLYAIAWMFSKERNAQT